MFLSFRGDGIQRNFGTNLQDAPKMGKDLAPETSGKLHIWTLLSAWEHFIEGWLILYLFLCNETINLFSTYKIKITLFWNITQQSLVPFHQSLKKKFCLCHQDIILSSRKRQFSLRKSVNFLPDYTVSVLIITSLIISHQTDGTNVKDKP